MILLIKTSLLFYYNEKTNKDNFLEDDDIIKKKKKLIKNQVLKIKIFDLFFKLKKRIMDNLKDYNNSTDYFNNIIKVISFILCLFLLFFI